MRSGVFNKLISLLLLCVLLTPFTSMASSILECLANPCNCGCSGHTSTWKGVTTTSDTNCNCPPYNKTDRSGCLNKFDLPDIFEVFYNKYCAEESPTTNFFTPKIKVRIQTCNLGCWNLSDDLEGNGECVIYPGSLGIPLMRLCARIALPADKAIPTDADDGYMYGVHLDYEGAIQIDPIYNGQDGKPVYMARPKVCAYWDPSFWDAVANYAGMFYGGAIGHQLQMVQELRAMIAVAEVAQNFKNSVDGGAASANDLSRGVLATFQPDLWDLNPVRQSNHYHQGGKFIIFQWLISLFKLGLSGVNLINSLIGMMPGYSMYYFVWIGILYWLIWAVVYIGEDIVVPALEYLGNLNNVVAASLGCVLAPLGPNPPPYCPTLTPPLQTPQVYEICQTIFTQQMVNGASVVQLTTLPSTSSHKCVNSTLPNNVINNSIRVAFDEHIPLCVNGAVASDKCVIMHGPVTPSVLHSLTSGSDIVHICSSSRPAARELPCVESPQFLLKARGDSAWSAQGVRLVYQSVAGKTKMVSDYFDSTAQDCGAVNSTICQSLWGINIGNFADLPVVFPRVERAYTNNSIGSPSVILRDSANTNVMLAASIARQKITTRDFHVIDSTQICVFDSYNDLVGCVPRPVPPKPIVYSCGPGTNATATCTSTFLNPAMIVKIQVGRYSTEGVVSVATSSGGGSKINLAGFDYDSFATDDDYNMIPFDGNHSLNPNSIYGNYKNNIPPYDALGNPNPNAVYLNGLEYDLSKYKVGGTLMCLTGYKFDDCLTGNTNRSCVLTNIVNSSYVNCTNFYNSVLIKYRGITLCNATQLADYRQVEVQSIPNSNGGTNDVTIFGSTATGPQYCYNYPNSNINGDLCKVGSKAADRATPSPSNGNVLNDTDYYNYNKSLNINGNVLAVRNKTAVEFGLCVEIPEPPLCPAIVANQASANGNATWTSVRYGEPSVGTCIAGHINTGADLQRYCLLDRASGQTALEPLPQNMRCIIAGACNISVARDSVTMNNIAMPQSLMNNNWRAFNIDYSANAFNYYNAWLYPGTYVITIPFQYQQGIQRPTVTVHFGYGSYLNSGTITLNGTQITSGSPSTYAANGWGTRSDNTIFIGYGGDNTLADVTKDISNLIVNGQNQIVLTLIAHTNAFISVGFNFSCASQ